MQDIANCIYPIYAGTWTVDRLSSTLESQPSIVRRHLGFWVSQGILKEQSTDMFTVVERLQEGTKTLPQGTCDHVIMYVVGLWTTKPQQYIRQLECNEQASLP